MTRVVVRELHRLRDLEAVQDLAHEVWRFEDRQVPSTFDLQVVGHVGGLTAGAYVGRELVGFVHGLPRTNLAVRCHHSHLLAVLPEFRGRGIAVRLKLFQRAWCLSRGTRLVTWTYDPLLVPNAVLNLVRLRATARRYLADVYGPLRGLYGGLPTDRFEVYWRLDRPAVARAARGSFAAPVDPDGLPRERSGRLPRAPRIAVEIPVVALDRYATDPAAVTRARRNLRRAATALFARGYEAVSAVPRGETALYVFARR